MRILVLSDLHNEFVPFPAPKVDVDAVVLAGDIDLHTRGIEWAIETWAANGTPVIYVIGNHEFYHAELHGIREQIAERAAKARDDFGLPIHVLDDSFVVLDDLATGKSVRFLGSTLWTDYKLFGDGIEMAFAMREAKHSMMDHDCIRCSPKSVFLPSQAAELHRKSVCWLSDELRKPFDGKTVVVTHHLPSMKSVAERFLEGPLSAAFASNLDHLVERADFWIHGHTHDSFDYQNGICRVICNPRGYVRKFNNVWQIENESFIHDFVVLV
jgi:predicted phosphodiesterase